jgi:hypothetical protein
VLADADAKLAAVVMSMERYTALLEEPEAVAAETKPRFTD